METSLYEEIYKHNRTQIGKLIFYAINAVIGFGITIIGFRLKDMEIVPNWDDDLNGFLIRGGILTFVFIASWLSYFWVMRKFENSKSLALSAMLETKQITNDEYILAMSAYMPKAKYFPFLISSGLYLAVMAPF